MSLLSFSGGGGTRDVMLENFSLSNGGKELVTDATVMLVFGRRYGLIGRNGTGGVGIVNFKINALDI